MCLVYVGVPFQEYEILNHLTFDLLMKIFFTFLSQEEQKLQKQANPSKGNKQIDQRSK